MTIPPTGSLQEGRIGVGMSKPLLTQEIAAHERERLQHEQTLAQLHLAEGRYQGIVEAMAEGVVLQDADGRIVAANPAAEVILGLTVDQMLGVTSVDPRWGAVREDGSPFPGELHPAMVTLRTGEALRDQVMGIDDPHTGRRWISVNTLRLPGDDPTHPERVLATFVDITQRKQLEAELAAHRLHLEALVAERTRALKEAELAGRAKSVFLSTMSHELRTPLAGIMGMTQLARRMATDARQSGYLDQSERSAQRLLQLVDNVLEFVAIESGGLLLDRRSFLVQDLVDAASRRFAATARAKGLHFELQVDPALSRCLLDGDAVHIGRVLDSLIDNAIGFTAQGAVSVKAALLAETPQAVELRFDVIDSGVGIAARERAHLFDPFHQVDGSLSRTHQGAGLSLAICQRLVQRLMGGVLDFESQPGVGSRFWFTLALPVARAPGAPRTG
ncbi:MAG: PAS domain S-box protein [Rubrivivax sp.]|nr:PAS domain S-box protein [Rubrivivax sp.]